MERNQGWSMEPHCKECRFPLRSDDEACIRCKMRHAHTGPADSRIAEATPREA